MNIEATDTLTQIADKLGNICIKGNEFEDQVIDTEAVAWYQTRFLLFVDDNCPAAIAVYMQKANADKNLNDLTKSHILYHAVQALEGRKPV